MGTTQSTAFWQASANGDVRTVRAMLEETPTLLHAEDSSGWTALHTACSNGHVVVVRELLHHAACVYSVDTGGCTPLHYACWNGYVDIVAELLSHGADVNATSTNGVTALHLAVTYGHLNCVNVLLTKHNADIYGTTTCKGNTSLHIACKYGLVDMAKLLLKHNDDDSKSSCADSDLSTVKYNNTRNDKTCIVNYKNKNGDTPLHMASSHDYADIVVILLQHKQIDVHVRNNDGIPPFTPPKDGGSTMAFAAAVNAAIAKKTSTIATEGIESSSPDATSSRIRDKNFANLLGRGVMALLEDVEDAVTDDDETPSSLYSFHNGTVDSKYRYESLLVGGDKIVGNDLLLGETVSSPTSVMQTQPAATAY